MLPRPIFLARPTFLLGIWSLVLAGALVGQQPPAPKPDAPKPDAAKPEAPKPDAAKSDAPKPDAPKPDAPKPDAAKTSPVELLLTGAQCSDKDGTAVDCELGAHLFVTFSNLKEWRADAPATNKSDNLVLVLNGRVMPGLNATGSYYQSNGLLFDLRILDKDENKAAWNALLRNSSGEQTMNVGVALAGNSTNNGASSPYYGPVTLTKYFKVLRLFSWIGFAFILFMLVVFILLAQASDIVRDGPSAALPDDHHPFWRNPMKVWKTSNAIPKKSFSLARCQMAWWFFIIVAAYFWIWSVTGDFNSLTQGALILMGISAATGLGATMIDSSKDGQRQSLETEQAAVTARVAALNGLLAADPAPANADDLRAELAQKKARLDQIATTLSSLPSPPEDSQSFLVDILHDETGVSFHRFQMAGWTVVLGFIFIVTVKQALAMPDFNATLLGLMGISSGTYVGFKISDPPK